MRVEMPISSNLESGKSNKEKILWFLDKIFVWPSKMMLD